MDQRQSVLNMISEIRETLDTKNRDDIYSSTTNVQSIFDRFYPKDSPFVRDLQYVRKEISMLIAFKTDTSPMGRELSEIKEYYNRLLISLIKEIETLGTPSKGDTKIDRSVKVNVNQQQTQEQIQVTQLSLFIEFIKDDITGKQYKELVEIAKNEPNAEKAKPKIIEKLKSFGEDVCSNIVANILTNPSIWNSLLG